MISAPDIGNQAGKDSLSGLRVVTLGSTLSFADALQNYFETYCDPSDYTRTSMISLFDLLLCPSPPREAIDRACHPITSEGRQVRYSVQNARLLQSKLDSLHSHLAVDS